jgi:ATP-dependent helicase HrpB
MYNYPMLNSLPIQASRDRIVSAVNSHTSVIIEAPTGSGKSTQVPQMLLDANLAGDGIITVLQPRRLAARMLARRVARERACRVGGTVGYQVRFDNCTSPNTRIRFETDGISLRHLHHAPTLQDTAILIFDEFHERHLFGDLMLGYAKQLTQTTRPDLKLVVMSATLDASTLHAYLPEAEVIRTAGRTFPVTIQHLAPNAKREAAPPWQLAAEALPGVLRNAPPGNVLVFMPGVYEINRTLRELARLPETEHYQCLPLHGRLSPAQQDLAVSPSAAPRIIVATNIAETSLTIEGVTAVIDSGLVRRAGFDPRRGINTLLTEKASQASADQRAGRAGRTQPGVALRLWTERDHKKRADHERPELLRIDLSETLLQMKRAGVTDIMTFPWVTQPPAIAVESALTLLITLGALDGDGNITERGERMAAFPLHPRISRMLLAGNGYECLPTLCLVAACIQEQNILLPRVDDQVRARRQSLISDNPLSDFELQVAAWNAVADHGFERGTGDAFGVHIQAARRVGALQNQLLDIAEQQGLDCYEKQTDLEAAYKALLMGFPDHLAIRTGGNRCSLSGTRRGSIDTASIVPREHNLLIATDIQEIGKGKGNVDVRLSGITAIREEWLEDCLGDTFNSHRHVFFDSVSGGRAVAEQQTCLGDLLIRSRRLNDVTEDEAAEILAAEVINGTITIKAWDKKVEDWIARVNLVAMYCPELGVPVIDDDARQALLVQVCHGAMGAKAVKAASVWPVLRQWLDSAQTAAVEAYAPDRIQIENGRTPRLHYDDPSGPYIAMRVQELYDTHQLPLLCNGKVRIKVHVLAPNQRPVQITDDLEHFWKDSYMQIKKDLKGRYPKHEWR